MLEALLSSNKDKNPPTEDKLNHYNSGSYVRYINPVQVAPKKGVERVKRSWTKRSKKA